MAGMPTYASSSDTTRGWRMTTFDSDVIHACKQHDVLFVKGGVTDYCVIGEIDVQALRHFQSSHRSPGKPFKPVPDGFEIDIGRKELPVGEAE